ncbi:hypothetical protein NicSoilC12_19260 [Arthrobacter sp. NicSoilC12]|nr:hypothetical protein NicSoilC12_19260 [Arthrobacter sp. NicSoilC12]
MAVDQMPATPQNPADVPGGPRAFTPGAPGDVGDVGRTQKSRDGNHRRDLGLRGIRDHDVPGMCHGQCPGAGDFPITSQCPMKAIAV